MKYVVLMYADERRWAEADQATRDEIMQAHFRFDEVVQADATLTLHGGEALQTADTATSLRHVDGEHLLTDGPFAETTEQLGGFYIVEGPDLDTVMDAVKHLPQYYVLEVRPVDTSV